SIIGGVFAQREFAVQVNVINGNKAVVLVHKALCAFLKSLGIFSGPPVMEVAVGVEQPSLIIEAVRELVPDHGANAAEIHGIIGLKVVKRRLQDSGGKVDIVFAGIVVSIHRRRRHLPLRLVKRLADLLDFTIHFKFVGAKGVAQSFSTDNFQRAVIPPFIGIANLVLDGLQLDQGLLLCGLAH